MGDRAYSPVKQLFLALKKTIAMLELIGQRRAVYPAQYNDKPVSRETIQKLLEAANRAPTHRLTQPWRFKVVLGEAKARLGEFMVARYQATDPKPKSIKISKIRSNTSRAAAVILIGMQRDPEERVPEWEELAATAMAVQNMWLACTDLGLGCYWSSPGYSSDLVDFTEFGTGEKCLGLFYLGYYDEDIPESARGPVSEKTVWVE